MGAIFHRKNGTGDIKLTDICLNKIKLLKLKEHFSTAKHPRFMDLRITKS